MNLYVRPYEEYGAVYQVELSSNLYTVIIYTQTGKSYTINSSILLDSFYHLDGTRIRREDLFCQTFI